MYFLVGSFTFITLNTPQKQQFAFTVFYVNVLIQTIIAFLQSINLLPSFWPNYWLVSYGVYPVATLSPHHLQIGIVMMIGISMSMFLFRLSNKFIIKSLLSLTIGVMLIVAVHAEIRTVWFALIGWVIAYIFIYRQKSIWPLILLGVFIIIAYMAFGRDYGVSVQEIINRRLLDPIEYQGLSGVIGDREKIYDTNPINFIFSQPWIILVGAGFQNVSYILAGATGAHNNYLQAFFELGIVGFIFYILFLLRIHTTLWKTIQFAKNKYEKFLSKDIWALFIAILITMLAGETMWAQYSAFTLTGQIMVIIGIAIAPLNWVSNNKTKYRKINSLYDNRY
jgi:hypothetical protein